MKALPRTAVWTVSIFLALIFVFVGLSKLEGPSAARWNDRFSVWGYPPGSHRVVGVIEILGGGALLIPGLRRFAAATLIIVMAGAVFTHVIHAEFLRTIVPLFLAGLALLALSPAVRP